MRDGAREGTWRPGPGKALFDAVGRSPGPLLIVADDLGFITADGVTLRDDCGFPGMRILQIGCGVDARNEFLAAKLHSEKQCFEVPISSLRKFLLHLFAAATGR